MDNIIPSGNYVIPRIVGNIKGRIVRVIFTELGEGLNEKWLIVILNLKMKNFRKIRFETCILEDFTQRIGCVCID